MELFTLIRLQPKTPCCLAAIMTYHSLVATFPAISIPCRWRRRYLYPQNPHQNQALRMEKGAGKGVLPTWWCTFIPRHREWPTLLLLVMMMYISINDMSKPAVVSFSWELIYPWRMFAPHLRSMSPPPALSVESSRQAGNTIRLLKIRRTLMLFNNVLLRTRRALLP